MTRYLNIETKEVLYVFDMAHDTEIICFPVDGKTIRTSRDFLDDWLPVEESNRIITLGFHPVGQQMK